MSHSLSLETAAVGSSTASEKVAFIQLMEEAKKDFPDLATLTTDGHLGIKVALCMSSIRAPHKFSCFQFLHL